MLFAPSPLSCGLVSSCTSSQSYPMFLFKAEISPLSKPSTRPDELEKSMLVCDLQLNAGYKWLNHHIKTFPEVYLLLACSWHVV